MGREGFHLCFKNYSVRESGGEKMYILCICIWMCMYELSGKKKKR